MTNDKTHRDLDLWKRGIELVVEIYRITKDFPSDERYGLVAQMRRAAVSIVSNVAEGASRHSKKDFARFLYTARGSASELETQIIVSRELGYLDGDQKQALLITVDALQKMASGLVRFLNKTPSPS